MFARVAQVSAAGAIALSLGLLAAPSASAAATPEKSATPVDGSASVCLNIPVPPVSVSICL